MRLTFLVAMVGMAACNESVAPPEFLGTYELTAVNGATPPVEISTHVLFETECHVDEMPGGSFTVNDGGRYARVRVERLRCDGSAPQTFGPTSTTGSWTIDGSTLTLLPDVVITERQIVGTVGASSITLVETRPDAQNQAFTYSRP